MVDDYDRGRRGEQANVNDWDAYRQGAAHQRSLDAMIVPTGHGPTITGEGWFLQTIVGIPFVVVGALLYPVTAAATLVVGLLCTRLMPLFGASGWQRWLAYVPMLVVFWIVMRWDQRAGERHAAYRRVRHVARLAAFAVVGYLLVGAYLHVPSASLPRLLGAVGGAGLGYVFLTYGGWQEFWHRTLTNFRLRPAD